MCDPRLMKRRFVLFLLSLLLLAVGLAYPRVAGAQSSEYTHIFVRDTNGGTVSDRTWHHLEYNDVIYDTLGEYGYWGGYFSFVPFNDGWYQVCVSSFLDNSSAWNGNEHFYLRYRINDNEIVQVDSQSGWEHGSGSVHGSVSGCATVYMVDGDYLNPVVHQNSDVALDIDSSGIFNWMTIDYIGPYPTPGGPAATDTPNATIPALVTAVETLAVTETPIPTDTPVPTDTPSPGTDPDPYGVVTTNTLSSGNTWSARRELTAGEFGIAVSLLGLLALAVFKLLVKVT